MKKMIQLNGLSAEDQTALEGALSERDAARDSSPAYIQILTAIGGWLSALFLLAAWDAFFLSDASSSGYMVPGVSGVAAGLLLRAKYSSPFLRQMGAGLLVAGQLGFAIGLTGVLDSTLGGVISCSAVALLTIFIERRGLAGPTTLGVTLCGLVLFLFDIPSSSLTQWNDVLFAAICVSFGLRTLLFRTNRLRVEYIGLTALAALIIYAEFVSLNANATGAIFGNGASEASLLQLWGGKAIAWIGALAVLSWARDALTKAELIASAALATFFLILLSFTSNAAFLLLLTGIILGWRPAAITGALAVMWSLSRFYYDLSITLLEKSLVLVIVGVLLLGLAYLIQKNDRKGAAL